MAIPESFLDDLRARVKVSAVVGAALELRREGTEYRAVEDPSLTVNDQKQLWFDHAKQQGGDIFEFLMRHNGVDFREAVAHCASLAGLPMPDEDSAREHRSPPAQKRTRAAAVPERQSDDAPAIASAAASTERRIAAVYEYTDPQGSLLYQVVRLEWDEDGKPKKTFRQRRPARSDDPPGKIDQDGYVWNLDGIDHTLYRLVELRVELEEGRTAFLVEGEKDADTLWEWGLPATTNSGGAKKWRPELAEHLRGADVVVMHDNDVPGREHAAAVGRSLMGIAKSVRMLDWRDWWPDVPVKADVTDWRDRAGGTADRLCEIVAQLPPWSPPPPNVRFRLLAAGDVKLTQGPRYLVRGLVPYPGMSVVWGPPKCGKSFTVSDMLMHVACGAEYRGKRVLAGAVVYIVLEGATGFEARIEAYRRRSGLPISQAPFYQVAARVDLVADHPRLIEDIRAQLGETAPVAICLDTLNRSLRGSESSDEDMGNYVKAVDALIEAFRCSVVVVHHCGIEAGRPRGHSSLTGAADAQLAVRRLPDKSICTKVEYLKDGPEGEEVLSRLEAVEVGREDDGTPVTSCVVMPVETKDRSDAAVGLELHSDSAKLFYRCLVEALGECGGKAPPGVKAPAGMLVVHRDAWRDVLLRRAETAEDDEGRRKERIKKGLQRATDKFQQLGLVGVDYPWVWRTDKRVRGFPATPHAMQANLAITPEDDEFDFAALAPSEAGTMTWVDED